MDIGSCHWYLGYRNVDKFNGTDQHGRPKKSYVDREIVPQEADVVRRIFELYASGLGLKAITTRLRQENATPPKPFVRKSDKIPSPVGDWAPSTVRTILTREIYKGLLVYNKTKKRDDYGQVAPTARPESEWIKTEVEHLRIVSNEVWERCAARRKEVEGTAVRFESGRLSGRPPKNGVQNLLAGLATCGVCGGGLVVETSARKNGRKPEYVCHRRRHHGTCTNALRIAVEEMNETILSSIEQHALTPEAVEQAIRLSERDDVREQQDALAKERQDAERRIARLVAVIADGGHAASLVASVRELENRVKAIDVEMRGLQPVPRFGTPGRGEPLRRVAAIVAAVGHAGPGRSAASTARPDCVRASGVRRRLRLPLRHSFRQVVYGHRGRTSGLCRHGFDSSFFSRRYARCGLRRIT